jgi:hypothetical protein
VEPNIFILAPVPWSRKSELRLQLRLRFRAVLKDILKITFFDLKGHGNEADFLGFLQELVPHESLTLQYLSGRCDFGFKLAEIFVFEK